MGTWNLITTGLCCKDETLKEKDKDISAKNREGERAQAGKGKRERERERISSRLHTVSAEPDVGLELTNC